MGVPRTKRIKWNQEKKKSFSSVFSMFYSSAKYKFYLHMFSGLNSETISDKKKKMLRLQHIQRKALITTF